MNILLYCLKDSFKMALIKSVFSIIIVQLSRRLIWKCSELKKYIVICLKMLYCVDIFALNLCPKHFRKILRSWVKVWLENKVRLCSVVLSNQIPSAKIEQEFFRVFFEAKKKLNQKHRRVALPPLKPCRSLDLYQGTQSLTLVDVKSLLFINFQIIEIIYFKPKHF